MENLFVNIINNFFSYEFVYIFLFFALINLAVLFITKNIFLKKTVLVIFSVFLALSVAEFFLCLEFENKIKSVMPYFDTSIRINRPDYELLKKTDFNGTNYSRKIRFFDEDGTGQYCILKSGQNFDVSGKHIIHDSIYNLYNNGFRYVPGSNKSCPDGAYVFLGCSFVFGEGINDNETLPYYFAEITDFKNSVINCGINGKSFTTALNIINNDVTRQFDLNVPVKRFIYSLIFDHIYRSFTVDNFKGNDNWLYVNGKWERLCYPYRNISLFFVRSYIFRKIFLPLIDGNTEIYKNLTADWLIRMNSVIKEKYNSQLTLIVWEADKFGENFIDNLKKSDIDMIVLPEKFNLKENADYRISDDWHPTAKANKEIAEILYNHFKAQEN